MWEEGELEEKCRELAELGGDGCLEVVGGEKRWVGGEDLGERCSEGSERLRAREEDPRSATRKRPEVGRSTHALESVLLYQDLRLKGRKLRSAVLVERLLILDVLSRRG
jgi:hypothetical protein